MVDLLCPKQRSLYPINYDFTKLRASTGNRTRNNSLEGCYANHYTIDALVLFETRSNISIASVCCFFRGNPKYTLHVWNIWSIQDSCCSYPMSLTNYQYSRSIVTDHTAMKSPVLVWSLKLSMARLGQYLDRRRPGNTKCWWHFKIFKYVVEPILILRVNLSFTT